MKVNINSYNLSRTLLALGTLLTLMANSTYDLFGNTVDTINNISIYNYTLFSILSENLVLAKLLAIFSLIIVISGIYPRITGLLHFYITFSFFIACDVIDGGDHIATNLTFLLVPITMIDTSKNHWLTEFNIELNIKKFILSVFLLLIKIQVFAIYFHAFAGKLYVDEWLNGTDTYYWMTHTYFGINDMFIPFFNYILSFPLIIILITWGTLFFEYLLSSALFFKKDNKLKLYLFITGILFHFSILIIHGLVSFFFTMSAALILYLIDYNKNYQIKTKKLWKKTF